MPAPTTSTSTVTNSFDISSYYDEISAIENNVQRSAIEVLALKSSGVTAKHVKRANGLERDFLNGLEAIHDKNGNQKWEKMLEMEKNSNKVRVRSSDEVPTAFSTCAGTPNQVKILLANAMIVDWQLNLRKKKFDEHECPFYQPSTQSVGVRTFFGHMKKYYDWQINENDLKNFPGSLDAVLKKEFQRREKEWVSEFFF